MANGVAQIRRSVLTLALPITVSSLLQRAEGIVAVFLVGGLGATSIAAVGLGQLLAFVATTLVSGLSVGTNVIVAQLWGARRRQDAGEAARHFLWLSLGLSLVLAGLGIASNRLVMQQLGAEPAVIELALPYSTLIFLVIPCTVLIQVLSSVLQGVGDTKTPMFAMIGVNLLHALLAYPLIYGRWGAPNLGIKGAAIAVGLAEATGALYLLLRCRPILKKSLRLRLDLFRSIWDVGASVSGERIVQQAGIFYLYQTCSTLRHRGLCRPPSRLVNRIIFVPAWLWTCHCRSHHGGTEYRRGEIYPRETGELGGKSAGHGDHDLHGYHLLLFSVRPASCLHHRRGRHRTGYDVSQDSRTAPSSPGPHHGLGRLAAGSR
jgi:hypothetical protein